ncbi:hypothetical protein CCMSSC00406_0001493 [Pleurotus cornucopiae]|uniref:Uncharacterized protein n=1 Tax=Pleurotus cornucopiae TaxID=5321 RepID=A0ACB7ILM3_PLECO|nr:hypothetical protein CCMSSC00406_0001493 [Pleurotus cornucopiae]
MARPPVNPEKSVAGIAVDPYTLDRVIPESRRPDGTVRKQLKIRPGFTPQEDVRRFRGTRQAEMDARALPKGHIVGWVPPSNSGPSSKGGGNSANAFPALSKAVNGAIADREKPLSKSAKKNAKRKEKREDKKADGAAAVKDSWEDDDDQVSETKETKPVPDVKETSASDERPEISSLEDQLANLEVK